jgi:hypothetical protein
MALAPNGRLLPDAYASAPGASSGAAKPGRYADGRFGALSRSKPTGVL